MIGKKIKKKRSKLPSKSKTIVFKIIKFNKFFINQLFSFQLLLSARKCITSPLLRVPRNLLFARTLCNVIETKDDCSISTTRKTPAERELRNACAYHRVYFQWSGRHAKRSVNAFCGSVGDEFFLIYSVNKPNAIRLVSGVKYARWACDRNVYDRAQIIWRTNEHISHRHGEGPFVYIRA